MKRYSRSAALRSAARVVSRFRVIHSVTATAHIHVRCQSHIQYHCSARLTSSIANSITAAAAAAAWYVIRSTQQRW